jgi:two-component system sensor histidine kinase/response regulator
VSTADSPANILVVDDTAENLRLLSSLLGEQGFRVRPVPNGRLALRAAESDPPDLILLDINMPEMDGYEVCRQLKAIDTLAPVPVIFLTALSETADKVKAFTAGGVDYITKPFQFEEVLARVKTHLALRRARLELEEKHARLMELERLRDDLVHMVVHDFRSSLAVLCGNLEFVAADAASLSEQSAVDLRTAMTAAQTITRMSNDLLDVSRLEEGKMPLTLAECDLSQVAKDVAAALASLDRTRTFEVSADVPVTADCDRGVVYRVAENILNNAIKHTPAGGRIRLVVSALPSRVRVAIADEGPGVPVEARARIFEKFGTVASRQNRKYHSSGLGLAFCKLAVEAHGGTIGVDDDHPKGSVFWFELPTRP